MAEGAAVRAAGGAQAGAGARAPSSRGALAWLLALWTALVTHGSLYPWRLDWSVSLGSRWWQMWHQPSWWTSTGDVLGNVVLFVPWGLLAWLLWRDERGREWRAAAVVVAGAWFAFALQLAQIVIPARDPQASDVAWNTLGVLLGIACTRLPRPSGIDAHGAARARVPLAMAALWLALQWWPLMPNLNRWHIRRVWHGLWQAPELAVSTALQAAFSLVLLALVWRSLRARAPMLCGLIALAVAGKLLTAGQVFTLSHLAGWAAGLGLAALAWRLPLRPVAWWGAATALVCFAFKALRPLDLRGTALQAWWPELAAPFSGTAPTDSLAWVWIAYWLLIALVLIRRARSAEVG